MATLLDLMSSNHAWIIFSHHLSNYSSLRGPSIISTRDRIENRINILLLSKNSLVTTQNFFLLVSLFGFLFSVFFAFSVFFTFLFVLLFTYICKFFLILFFLSFDCSFFFIPFYFFSLSLALSRSGFLVIPLFLFVL